MKISKKITFMLSAILATGILTACSSNDSTNNNQQATQQESQQKEEPTVDSSNMAINSNKWNSNMVSAEKVTDYNGKPVLKLVYGFENIGEESAAPFTSVQYKAFQNGVELDSLVISNDIDSGIGQKEILPGGKIENAETGFLLSDDSEVTIHVEDWISFDGTLAEFKIKIDSMEIIRVK